MSQTIPRAFDPYHSWLGIPPYEQPATLYRLLGVNPYESDPDVIESAADRQISYVRGFLGQQFGELAVQLLVELNNARLTLSDRRRREAYDQVIKQAVPGVHDAAALLPPASVPLPAVPEKPRVSLQEFTFLECTSKSKLYLIWKVQHDPTGRFLYLKTIAPPLAANPELRKRFQREVEICTKLRHVNLIAGLIAGEDDGVPYLVLEYVIGTDLATIVKHVDRMPLEQVVDYTTQSARGLAELHRQGVYHRNVKPHVLLVDLQGRVKVTNLLLARFGEGSVLGDHEELTTMGEVVGTLDYQAPEQAADAAAIDARTDVYALGCTLHYLVTGRPPYGGKSLRDKVLAHRHESIPSLARQRSDVPRSLDRVFQKMLAKQPSCRYSTMEEAADALEASLQPTWFERLWSFMNR